MAKLALIGAMAPLLLLGLPARAEWRTPIHGADPTVSAAFTPARPALVRPPAAPLLGTTPILPPRFTPMGSGVSPGPDPAAPVAPRPVILPANLPAAAAADDEAAPQPVPAIWSLPLVDRRLNATERSADLAVELQDVIKRAEPMYDPTRLDGPDAEVPMSISSGTAAMNNVFADNWRRASPDANINVKTAYLAMAWEMTGALPCDAFLENRPHHPGDPALTALSGEDCRRLLRYEALPFDLAPPIPVVAAPISVPVFAAPLPGSRMSSQDFWAEQKARIQAIQAHLQDKWQAGQWPGAREQVSEAGPRR